MHFSGETQIVDVVESTNDALHSECSWTRIALLAVVYIVIWIALWYTVIGINRMTGVNLWAPCAGLTFAILLAYGWRALPLPLLASLLAEWPIWSEERWPYSLAASVIPLLGYLIAAYILRHHLGGKRLDEWRFDDPQRVAAFLGVVMLSTLFAALAEAPLLQAAGLPLPVLSWLEMVWQEWISAFVGVVTVTPLVLIFVAPLARRFSRKESLHPRRTTLIVESPPVHWGILQGGISVALIAGLFWMPHPQWLGQSYPFMTLLLLPILTWIAAAYGMRGAASTVLLYQLGIVILVLNFAGQDLAFQYQIAMAVIATSGLLTGAITQAQRVDIGRFRDLAEVSNDFLWEFDDQGRLCDLRGQRVCTIGASANQLGKHWREYVPQEEQSQGADFTRLWTAIRQRQRFQHVVLQVWLPGGQASIWTCNSGLPLFSDSGEFRGYRGTTTDISDYKNAEASLREQAEALLQDYDRTVEAKVEARVVERTRMLAEVSLRNWRLANFDSLTGLPNRNLFFEHLRKSLQQSRRQWRLLALLLVDLDGFKEVNDTFGHDMGDELLRQVAVRLRQCIRATDTAARLGGDEFTIVLTDLEQVEAAEAVARKLVASLAEPVPLGEASATVTASVGIAFYRPEWPANLEQAMALLRQADVAMYEAKRAGKNGWRFAEQVLETA